MIKLCGGQITQENLALSGWFAANIFRQVAEREVYRVCRFVAKRRQLGFIGGYDNGHNSRISLLGSVFDSILDGEQIINSGLSTA